MPIIAFGKFTPADPVAAPGRSRSATQPMIEPSPTSPAGIVDCEHGAVQRRFHRQRRWLSATLLASGLTITGCAVVGGNHPHNLPLASDPSVSSDGSYPGALPAATEQTSEVAVALSFSGGGLRAAAFAQGAMEGLAAQPGPPGKTLLQQVSFITSVSGGSLAAAWVGLNGTESLSEFRRTALLHSGSHELRSDVLNSVSLMRLAGDGLPRWLDEEIFHGATFARMSQSGYPLVWINATDLNQHLPFAFNQKNFDELCSDIGPYSVAEAVAASMAVPLVFSPVVLEKHPESCSMRLPKWAESDGSGMGKSMLAEAMREAMLDYRDVGNGRYVKLVDGGLTDNFGLSSIQQSRLLMGTPLAPLSEAEALRIGRLLFVVVDAGRRPAVNWNRGIDGPGWLELSLASIDAAIDTNMRLSYDGFLEMSRRWRDDIVTWRCAQPEAEQQRQRAQRADWRCDDVQISVSRISFDDLAPGRARQLHGVSTTLTLPQNEIDAVIDAGRDAMLGNAVVQAFSQAVRATPWPTD